MIIRQPLQSFQIFFIFQTSKRKGNKNELYFEENKNNNNKGKDLSSDYLSDIKDNVYASSPNNVYGELLTL